MEYSLIFLFHMLSFINNIGNIIWKKINLLLGRLTDNVENKVQHIY